MKLSQLSDVRAGLDAFFLEDVPHRLLADLLNAELPQLSDDVGK